ncbi:ketosynthase chain-length factor [Pseudonocardia endophytica]|uniref:Act minimal PKS chain-length factor (CLF/KS beta) n=1 Tax=Pseudonocardia endophytica TaxID=401976 RepID=A0A4R1HNB5_PSEEN|nr:ketosynthase chain-length factor [Pseudonocardia endophytica]TCK22085.1 act minimal PKS chain-length factor (CLF/KS beta) [Pseudonocardia endophytica]
MTTTVVTGLGVVAPTGLGAEEHWAETLAGRSGIGEITRFDARGYPSRLAGEVRRFRAEDHLPGRLLPQTDHMTRLALVAADRALADSGVTPDELPALRSGVVTASSAGGFEFGHRELEALWSRGGEYVSAYQAFAWFYAVNTGQISIRNGLKGPSGVLVSDQAGGLDAIGQARRRIRRGDALVVTGGVDGSLCSWGWVAQLAGGRLSTGTDPATAYLPFDGAAAGHLPGEGGALLVLEERDAALARNAPVYGEIAGYCATFDPPPGSDREPALRRAIRGALDDAGVRPSDVDIVFADAAADDRLDRVESRAIADVFGDRAVPVTAPKVLTGRLGAGAGSLDVATALLALRDGVVPPTPGPQLASHHPIDLVTAARRTRLDTAVVLARGEGGFNSAVVVRTDHTHRPDHLGEHR